MVAFIDAHRETYGVEPICAQLPIAPSTYFETKARQADPSRQPARAQRDDVLRGAITRVWHANRRVYGVRKVWRQFTTLEWVAWFNTCRVMEPLGYLSPAEYEDQFDRLVIAPVTAGALN